jgi:IS30 family transposase
MQEKLKWSHFTQNDRDRIEILLGQGYKQKEIAKVLNKSKSAISREITKRSLRTGVYNALSANTKAQIKRSNSKYQGMKVETDIVLQKRILKELKAGRSPDEIAGMLRDEGFNILSTSGYTVFMEINIVNTYALEEREKKIKGRSFKEK